jgi:protein phosphatase
METNFQLNQRGAGYYFNEKALEIFLKRNSLKMMIRSHELNKEGFLINFESCLTIFSSANYCRNQNDGSIAFINEENMIDIFPLNDCGFFWHLRRIFIPHFASFLFHFDICLLNEYNTEVDDHSNTFLLK